MKKISGNKLLVKALKEEGVDVLFGYPGACTIDISDELYKQDYTRVVLPRHEQALIHAADAYARTTGKVGVCLVTSGPGATNLVTGIATANMDSVPLVCFTGQVSRNLIGNDAFQEVDIIGITRNICKFGIVVRKREDLGRIIKEAFYIARTGRPGPVVIDLPKDVMVYEIEGSLFFGTVRKFEYALERAGSDCKAIIFRMRNLIYLDAGGIQALEQAKAACDRKGITIILSGIHTQPFLLCEKTGMTEKLGKEKAWNLLMVISLQLLTKCLRI